MAVLANGPVKLSVGRDLFHIGGRPAPDDPDSVVKSLLMTSMAIYFFMRTLLPGFHSSLHDVAGPTEVGVILNIVVETITAQDDSEAQQDQD